MPTTAVEVKNLTKVFGQGALACQALRGVDLHVQQGEFIMLAGPSGSGKTTLLSIIGCVLRGSSGDVSLFGDSVSSRKESDYADLRLAYIGFIFQGHNLIASLSAMENVALLLKLRGHSTGAARARAMQLLDLVGLADKGGNTPKELSGGQRQRVAVARALAGDPPLLLADEPTAALDAENGLKITDLLKRLAKEEKRTAIVVTHDSRIFHLADRMVHLEDGLIQPQAS